MGLLGSGLLLMGGYWSKKSGRVIYQGDCGKEASSDKKSKACVIDAIMVLVAVPIASAESDILLGKNTGTGRIQFFADDGKGNFTLSICAQVVSGVCLLGKIIGRAVGQGFLLVTMASTSR